jgi:hypothetical protein
MLVAALADWKGTDGDDERAVSGWSPNSSVLSVLCDTFIVSAGTVTYSASYAPCDNVAFRPRWLRLRTGLFPAGPCSTTPEA